MTKITKKSNKKAFLFIALAIAIIAVLSFGATYALFTATSTQKGMTFKTGHVHLTSEYTSEVTSGKEGVMPKDKILGKGDVKFTVDTSDAKGNYVAIIISITAQKEGGESLDISSDLNIDIKTALGEGWAEIATHPGMYILGTEATPTAKMNEDEVDVFAANLTFDATDNWDEASADKSDGELMNASITVKIRAASVQVSGLTNAAEGVSALVGKLTLT